MQPKALLGRIVVVATFSLLLAAGSASAQVGGGFPPDDFGSMPGGLYGPEFGGEEEGILQGSFQPPPPIRPGQPVSVLVFPIGYAGEEAAASLEAPEDVGVEGGIEEGGIEEGGIEEGGFDDVPGANGAAMPVAGLSDEQLHLGQIFLSNLKWGMGSSGQYYLYSYSPQASMVRRASRDEVLTEEHLVGLVDPATGVVDVDKAREVARRLGMQTILICTVEEFQETTANGNRTNVTISIRLLASVSGKTLRSAAVTGSAAAPESVPVEFVQESAMRDAALRVLPEVGVQLISAAPTTETRPMTNRQRKRLRKQERKAASKAKRQGKAAARAARRNNQNGATEVEETPVDPESGVAPPTAPGGGAGALVAPGASSAPAGNGEAPTISAPTAPSTGSQYGGYQQPPIAGNAYGTNRPNERVVPRRRKKGLRVPPWLGVAGFLTGINFLLK